MKSNQRITMSQGEDLNKESLMASIPVEYKLVRAEGKFLTSYDAYRKLEELVNEKLKKGWKLCGGVSIGSISAGYFSICQAMIKEEKM